MKYYGGRIIFAKMGIKRVLVEAEDEIIARQMIGNIAHERAIECLDVNEYVVTYSVFEFDEVYI